MVFATHAGLYNFNGISDEEIPYLQDLISADAVCIQHGLTVQDLAFNANQAFNNNKLYYCASKYEVQNLRQPQYGYLDSSAIRQAVWHPAWAHAVSSVLSAFIPAG